MGGVELARIASRYGDTGAAIVAQLFAHPHLNQHVVDVHWHNRWQVHFV